MNASQLPTGNFDPLQVGVVVVDHGSRRLESNEMLLEVAELFARRHGFAIVEPAHMELAEPSIQTAVDRCVARGARMIVVFPYLLSPGRHWRKDIPRLAAAAVGRHAGVGHVVTAPLGLHPLLTDVMQQRITECLSRECGSSSGSWQASPQSDSPAEIQPDDVERPGH